MTDNVINVDAEGRAGPKFGVWANVYGTWASAHHPDDPVDASWRRNLNLIQQLSLIHISEPTRPY